MIWAERQRGTLADGCCVCHEHDSVTLFACDLAKDPCSQFGLPPRPVLVHVRCCMLQCPAWELEGLGFGSDR
jgi:hypothetical protein